MDSTKFIGQTNSPYKEFGRLLAEEYFFMSQRFDVDEVYFLADSKPYWRNKVYDKYYDTYYWIYMSPPMVRGEVKCDAMLLMDNRFYHIQYNESTEEYFKHPRPLSNKKINELYVDSPETDFECELSMMDWIIWDGKKEPFVEQEAISAILKNIPTYKGNREDKEWKSKKITEDEYPKLQAMTTRNIAATMRAKYIKVPGLEADDLAYVVSELHPTDQIIFATTDGDWTQISLTHPNSIFYNVKAVNKDGICTSRDKNKGKKWTDLQWKGESEAKEMVKLAVKLLCGDGKDNIKPTPEIGRATCYSVKDDGTGAGKDKITELLFKGRNHKDGPWAAVNDYFENSPVDDEGCTTEGQWEGSNPEKWDELKAGRSFPPAYQRNKELILLPELPDDLFQMAWDALQDTPIKPATYEFDGYKIDRSSMFSIKSLANSLSERDKL
jgi:hypothetical protein